MSTLLRRLRPAYPIATERRLLRPFAPEDLDALVAIHGRPEAVRYLYVRDREQLRGVLVDKQARTALVKEGDALNLAATLAATGELVGDMSLFWVSEANRQGEVGYILNPDPGARAARDAARGPLHRERMGQGGVERRGGLRDAGARVGRGHACCGRVSALTKSSSWRVIQHS